MIGTEDELAAMLDRAATSGTAIPAPSSEGTELPLEAAYHVQHKVVGLRLARGERAVGVKLGFTSEAKMAQMGVSEIIAGRLTDAMWFGDGERAGLGGFIHPRIEPEVAFRLGEDVDLGGARSGGADIGDAVDAVAAAMEIIDSRYSGFRFGLSDVVADNTSAAGFVLGPWRSPDTATGDRAVSLSVDGTVTATGSTAAILGNPLNALRALVPLAAKRGLVLPAGSIVLAGAATAATPLTASVVTTRIEGLGEVSIVAAGDSAGDRTGDRAGGGYD
ncbi:4-oxalocrotonate decarboxylase [Saccharomonospora sp. NPDC006951]